MTREEMFFTACKLVGSLSAERHPDRVMILGLAYAMATADMSADKMAVDMTWALTNPTDKPN